MHGEQNEMGRLKAALIREYEDNPVSLLSVEFSQYLSRSLCLVYGIFSYHEPRDKENILGSSEDRS